jgi:hypothetical protein
MSCALPTVSRQGPLGDVWDVCKRPRTRLERPPLPGLLREMRRRVANRLVRRGRLGRLKPSQVVPRRGLEVPSVAGVIERAMSPRFAADTGIGADASPALPTRAEASPRAAVEKLVSDGPQRVRALGRATRSANGAGLGQRETTVESSARQSSLARRRRSESRLQIAAGGPGPLTEDRQKTGMRL